MAKYLTGNGYIKISKQKGGIPGVSGCLEHKTMIWETTQRKKMKNLNIDVVWLDMTMLTKKIQLPLRMQHVPEDIEMMLDKYFNGFRM